jgi:hypothetical protein
VSFDARSAREWAPVAATLAEVEGLEGHRRSALARAAPGDGSATLTRALAISSALARAARGDGEEVAS